jgi:hypothetical protein
MDLKWWVKDQSLLIGNVCRSDDNDTIDWFVLAANSDCAASYVEDPNRFHVILVQSSTKEFGNYAVT